MFSDSIYKTLNDACIWHVQISTFVTLSTWCPSYWSLVSSLCNFQTLISELQDSSLIWTLCSCLTWLPIPQISFQFPNSEFFVWNTWAELVNGCSAPAEANVWTPLNSELWLSGAVHTLWGWHYNNSTPLTRDTLNRVNRWDMNTQVCWCSGYPERSSWGAPTVSDELYSCLEKHPWRSLM